MTCRHVLDLIDAGPFADASQEHLDAAWQHARHCTGCAAALATSTTLTTELATLPQPAPSPELAATVLARIARMEQRQGAPAGLSTRMHPATTRDRPAWATAAGGVAVVFATALSTPYGNAALSEIVSLKVGATGGGGMPLATASAVVLAAALVLYAAGLFASLSGGRRA